MVATIFDITDDIPLELGIPIAGTTTESAQVPSSIRWDCSIGALPFLLSGGDRFPYQRQTDKFRKDRVDTERNPGEQSLDSGYWIRSQSSWHYGSGITSAEPIEVDNTEAAFRYKEGGGVNPWTPGELTLLNSTSSIYASAGASQLILGVDTGVLHATGSTLKFINTAGTATTITWGGSGTITSITSDGSNWYAADSTGIYKGALTSGAGSLVWNTGASTIIRWVKSRLVATIGAGIYELTGTGPTLPTALDAGTARPSGWTWTDIAEGPTAIYLCGYVNDYSTVEKVAVTASSTSITLSQPVIVAEMPRGESMYSLYSYVGAYLVLGTSKGCRVSSIASDGTLRMGPLVVESTDGVKDAVADGSYLYVTVGALGNSGDRTTVAGLWRVDLGQNLNNNVLDFAAAADLCAPSGTSGKAEQVTIAGGKLWFVVNGVGVFQQDATYVATGWIETGRIRVGTMESKVWRDLRLLGENGLSGTVTARASITGLGAPSTWDAVVEVNYTQPDATGSLTAVAPSPQPNLFVAFKLTASDDRTASSRFIGYQLRTTPSPRRTELIQVPLQCFDYEEDSNGARFGYEGSAWDRYQLLKTLEDYGGTVQWKDYTTGEVAEAFIEEVQLTRLAVPTKIGSGAGGIVQITMRLV